MLLLPSGKIGSIAAPSRPAAGYWRSQIPVEAHIRSAWRSACRLLRLHGDRLKSWSEASDVRVACGVTWTCVTFIHAIRVVTSANTAIADREVSRIDAVPSRSRADGNRDEVDLLHHRLGASGQPRMTLARAVRAIAQRLLDQPYRLRDPAHLSQRGFATPMRSASSW